MEQKAQVHIVWNRRKEHQGEGVSMGYYIAPLALHAPLELIKCARCESSLDMYQQIQWIEKKGIQ